jgi:hypothetical protein
MRHRAEARKAKKRVRETLPSEAGGKQQKRAVAGAAAVGFGVALVGLLYSIAGAHQSGAPAPALVQEPKVGECTNLASLESPLSSKPDAMAGRILGHGRHGAATWADDEDRLWMFGGMSDPSQCTRNVNGSRDCTNQIDTTVAGYKNDLFKIQTRSIKPDPNGGSVQSVGEAGWVSGGLGNFRSCEWSPPRQGSGYFMFPSKCDELWKRQPMPRAGAIPWVATADYTVLFGGFAADNIPMQDVWALHGGSGAFIADPIIAWRRVDADTSLGFGAGLGPASQRLEPVPFEFYNSALTPERTDIANFLDSTISDPQFAIESNNNFSISVQHRSTIMAKSVFQQWPVSRGYGTLTKLTDGTSFLFGGRTSYDIVGNASKGQLPPRATVQVFLSDIWSVDLTVTDTPFNPLSGMRNQADNSMAVNWMFRGPLVKTSGEAVITAGALPTMAAGFVFGADSPGQAVITASRSPDTGSATSGSTGSVDDWLIAEAWPAARAKHAAWSYDAALFVFGGSNKQGVLGDLWCYQVQKASSTPALVPIRPTWNDSTSMLNVNSKYEGNFLDATNGEFWAQMAAMNDGGEMEEFLDDSRGPVEPDQSVLRYSWTLLRLAGLPLDPLANQQVRQTPSWPRSWANFSLF